eukprot:7450027-Pyramimonas_sp.AAC.1
MSEWTDVRVAAGPCGNSDDSERGDSLPRSYSLFPAGGKKYSMLRLACTIRLTTMSPSTRVGVPFLARSHGYGREGGRE